MEHQDEDGRKRMSELLLAEPAEQTRSRRDVIAQMGADMVLVR